MPTIYDKKKHKNAKIMSQSDAAKLCNMSRQSFMYYIKKYADQFDPWLLIVDGIKQVDANHKGFKKFQREMKGGDRDKAFANYKRRATSKRAVTGRIEKNVDKIADGKTDKDTFDEALKIALEVETAKNQQEINKARISNEKAKQLEIKTLELQKDLAPISLLEFFFSFAENMIQELYRRPAEIEADLEALFLAGEKKQATKKTVRELEAIVKRSVNEMVESLKNEGYKNQKIVKDYERKVKG